MMNLKVWCLLIDHGKKAASGNAFSVIVGRDAYIDDLKKMVKEKRPVVLRNVDSAMLNVWRCMNPKLLSKVDETQMEKDLSNVDFTYGTKAVWLGAEQKITTLGLSDSDGDGEILLLRLLLPLFQAGIWLDSQTQSCVPPV
ncbi:hypothetical protein ACEPAG_2583 [Sanghuangporus baumii]